MLHLLAVCSMILGVLGVIMSCYSLYIILLNEKLEIKLVERDMLIAEQVDMIEENKKIIIEKDGYIRILREDLSVKDRTINHLRRSKKG